jgi:AraC-like DNA-binding protein
MRFGVQSLSHSALVFTEDLPTAFTGMRLGGATVQSATGSFGSLCIQEFDGSNFMIRYTVIVTEELFTVRFKSLFNGLHGFILQHGDIVLAINDAVSLEIKDGQFTLLHAPEPEFEISFQPHQQYILFEILLPDVLAIELAGEFRQLHLPFSKIKPELWVNPAQYIDEEVKDHIRYILHYVDNPAWRRNYYDNRVWDIGWKLLAIHIADEMPNEISEEELQKARAVQKLILDNLDKHLLVRELAKKVGISESKLKQIFTKLYGMGIHEYRIQQRLKLAIVLIQEGKLVKEAAAMTGWRPADLIKAYFKIYRTTPGKIKGTKK